MASALEDDVVHLSDFRATPDGAGRGKVIGMSVRRLRLQSNRTYALVSASGRGKSVFLSLLAGFPPPSWRNAMSWSSWKMFGENIPLPASSRRVNHFSPLFPITQRSALIYLPQNFPQDRAESLTALEAMAFVLCASGRAQDINEAKQRVTMIVSQSPFNLDATVMHQPLHQLSGGERRRVELATRLEAICRRDSENGLGDSCQALVLLDEPTTGLDILHESEFIRFLSVLRETAASRGIGIVILVATHAFTHLSPESIHFDEVLVLDRDEPGLPRKPASMIRLVFQGTKQAAFKHFGNFSKPGHAVGGWKQIIELLEQKSSDELEEAFYRTAAYE